MQVPSIDWSQPWLGPYREVGQRVWARWVAGASVAQALNAERAQGGPWPCGVAGELVFVPQHKLPPGQGYEAFIHAHGQVPTRDNLHDFFNGLVWLHAPAIKRCLNAQHVVSSLASPMQGRRGVVRDALTVFDENAAIWQAPWVLQEALRRRDWPALFVTHRSLWSESVLTLFGHALLEKLCQPRKPITAHVWCVPAESGASCDQTDALIAQLEPARLAQRQWSPLPVLGVPGWWPANEVPGFYDDASVFRPHSLASKC